MYMFDELKEMLEKELKNIVKQDAITPQNLDGAGKAVDILKDIETIEAMRESQYSNNSYNSYEDRSYRMMHDGDMSYAQRRDSMGRYSSRRYSRHAETDHMIAKLEAMYDTAEDPAVKQAIDQCISKLEG